MVELNCYYYRFVEDIPVSYYGPTILNVSSDTSVECIKNLLIKKQSPYQIHANNIDDITVQIVSYLDPTTCIKLTNNQLLIRDAVSLLRKSESYTIHWYLSKIKTIRYQLSRKDKLFNSQLKLVYLSDDMKLDEIKTTISNELNIPTNCFKILFTNNIEMNPDKTLSQLGITLTTSYPSDNQLYRQMIICDN